MRGRGAKAVVDAGNTAGALAVRAETAIAAEMRKRATFLGEFDISFKKLEYDGYLKVEQDILISLKLIFPPSYQIKLVHGLACVGKLSGYVLLL